MLPTFIVFFVKYHFYIYIFAWCIYVAKTCTDLLIANIYVLYIFLHIAEVTHPRFASVTPYGWLQPETGGDVGRTEGYHSHQMMRF